MKKTICLLIVTCLLSINFIETVNANNIDITKNNINNIGKIEKILHDLIEKFKKMFFKIIRNNELFLNDYFNNQEDEIIIKQSYETFNNITIQNEIIKTRAEIIQKINNNNQLMNFLKINNTFCLNNILDRINSLKIGFVKNQVLDFIGYYQLNDYNSFTNVFNISLTEFLTFMYYNNFSLYSLFPVIDFICQKIAEISLLWCIPLLILFGMSGIIISAFISMIFFAPIVIPMALYIAMVNFVMNNSLIWYEVQEIAFYFGLVGLLTIGLQLVFTELFNSMDYVVNGFIYIFSKILLCGFNNNDDPYFSECKPVLYVFGDGKKVKKGKEISISVNILDSDMVQYKNNFMNRDYVRIGACLNKYNSSIYWSDWYCADASFVFDTGIIFNTVGWHTVYLFVQDNWGVYGDVVEFHVFVENPRIRNR